MQGTLDMLLDMVVNGLVLWFKPQANMLEALGTIFGGPVDNLVQWNNAQTKKIESLSTVFSTLLWIL